MAKLTRSRLAQISEVLDKSLFTSAAFTIDSDEESLVIIKYRDNPKYYARLYYARPKSKDTIEALTLGHAAEPVLWAEVCPGGFVEEEEYDDISFDHFLAELGEWTARLRSEIVLVDTFEKQFSAFQKELNQKLERHFKDANAHFSEEERDEIDRRLRELETKIEELKESNQATEAQVRELRQVISDLSQAAHTLPKKAWLRTACSKFFNLSQKVLSSKAGQKVIEALIDRMLTGPKA
jgi:DNA repair exonuclease SbcCD ATPase subunit